MSPAKLQALPGFQGDIDAFPEMQTKTMAVDMLVLVRDAKVTAVPLESRTGTGDLGDCYKLYFDPDGSGKPRYRVVYRWLPDEVQAVALQAVAVGERAGLDAYVSAARNLGR